VKRVFITLTVVALLFMGVSIAMAVTTINPLGVVGNQELNVVNAAYLNLAISPSPTNAIASWTDATVPGADFSERGLNDNRFTWRSNVDDTLHSEIAVTLEGTTAVMKLPDWVGFSSFISSETNNGVSISRASPLYNVVNASSTVTFVMTSKFSFREVATIFKFIAGSDGLDSPCLLSATPAIISRASPKISGSSFNKMATMFSNTA